MIVQQDIYKYIYKIQINENIKYRNDCKNDCKIYIKYKNDCTAGYI